MNAEEVARLKRSIPPEEGIILTNFNRRISTQIVKHLGKSRLSPNEITVMSFLVAIAAGLCFSFGMYSCTVIGAILVQLSFTLDCIDGQLARFKNMTSNFGKWLDRILDRFSEFAIFFGLCFGLYKQSHDVQIWICGLLVIFTLSLLNYAGDMLGPLPSKGMIKRKEIGKKLSVVLKVKNLIKPGYISFGRDIQMFLIFIGCILNQISLVFWVIIILGNIHWIIRAYVYWEFSSKEG